MSDFRKMEKILQRPKIALVLGLILGGFIRLSPALSADFPIKDGGLFSVFIDEIPNNHFVLPAFIPYNGLTIPFAYPPLSFYLTAILSFLFKISSIELIKILPSIFAVLTIPAFYWLASTILESELLVCYATLSFALLPTAIDFMIVGGGLPRSLGYLFAMLALGQTWRLFTRTGKHHLVWSILWTSLTFLTHPVVAKFLLFSMVMIFLFKGRTKIGLGYIIGIACGAILLSSPWWLLVISRHGFSPIFNASQAAPQSWTSYLAAFLFMQTNEPYLHLQGLIALIGIFVCLSRRNYWLPTWLAAIFVFEPRLVASYSILPTALLVGTGLDFLIASLNPPNATHNSLSALNIPPLSVTSKIMLGFFLLYTLISAFIAAPRQYLSTGNREAMQWIRNNLPSGSQFLVISEIYGPGEDFISEWFPVLTNSISLTTPQGMEWISGSEFIGLWQNHDRLQACGETDTICLDDWEKSYEADYFYIIKNQYSNTKIPRLRNLTQPSEQSPIFHNHEIAIYPTN